MNKKKSPTHRQFRSRRKKPRLGQHILADASVIRTIIEVARLCEEDHVLEIGAGTGVLTSAAAPLVKHLTALEVDARLCALLGRRLCHHHNLTIINADALTFDYCTLDSPFKVIGNLPYNIATPLLMRLIEDRHLITDMTLMFQEEVAKRLTASPGGKDYGALTIKVQVYAKVEKWLTVPPRSFRPPPRVKSALVKVNFLEKPRVSPGDRKLFVEIVEAAFAHRRKTIKNSLGIALRSLVDEKKIEGALQEARIDPTVRGETLSLEDYLELSDRIGMILSD